MTLYHTSKKRIQSYLYLPVDQINFARKLCSSSSSPKYLKCSYSPILSHFIWKLTTHIFVGLSIYSENFIVHMVFLQPVRKRAQALNTSPSSGLIWGYSKHYAYMHWLSATHLHNGFGVTFWPLSSLSLMTYARNCKEAPVAPYWYTAPTNKAGPGGCHEGFLSERVTFKHLNVPARKERHSLLLHKHFASALLDTAHFHCWLTDSDCYPVVGRVASGLDCCNMFGTSSACLPTATFRVDLASFLSSLQLWECFIDA